jgi:hypothetical protein
MYAPTPKCGLPVSLALMFRSDITLMGHVVFKWISYTYLIRMGLYLRDISQLINIKTILRKIT